MTDKIRPFHLAFPVKDLKEAKKWYCNVLGCTVGLESSGWIDFTRFKGLKGEQYTLFILDPSGNALEFKSFKNDSMIFQK